MMRINNHRFCKKMALAAGLLALAALAPQPATAVSYVWTGLAGAGSEKWNNAANWNTTPGSGNNISDLIFYQSGAGNLTNCLGASFTCRQIFYTNVISDVATYLSAEKGDTTSTTLLFQRTSAISTALISVDRSCSAHIQIGNNVGNIMLDNSLVVTNGSISSTLTIGRPINERGTVYGGAKSLTKNGSGKLVLASTNTYSGSTLINAGTLALGSGGSINNSTNLFIAAGATYDVSAIPSYTASSNTALAASGNGTTDETQATIKGGTTVNLGSRGITLTWGGATSGTNSTHPCLVVSSGALTLNNNAFTINGPVLGYGTYTLISVTGGTINQDASPSYAVSGTAINGTNLNVISMRGGTMVLKVSSASLPSLDTVVTTSRIGAMEIDETNTVKVVIKNIGAPATNVTSTLIHSGVSGAFLVSSNNVAEPRLGTGASITNTYDMVAKANGSYTVTIQALSAETVSETSSFTIAVGSQISYLTNSIAEITNLFGGVANGRYEPGEVIDITVFSFNDGARSVSSIVNSISADPTYFAITNLTSQYYPALAVGAVTSTTYQVTILAAATHGTYWFSVTNRTVNKVWPGSFPLNVFKQGFPLVSPPSITIPGVLPGVSATNTQVTVTNSGNVAFTFSIADNGAWDVSYNVTTGSRGISDFVTANSSTVVLNDPNTNSIYIEAATEGVGSAEGIGFSFPFYGSTYSNFYVTADGTIGLINTTNVPAQSADRRLFPTTNGAPLIAPFWGNLTSPTGSIKTVRSKNNYLVISYSGVAKDSGLTNLQFQTALFTDGRIEFRYKTITGVTNTYGLTNVTIGIQGSTASYTNLPLVPVNGTSILLTPQKDQWVRYAPAQDVTVAPLSSQGITFIANAAGKTAATSTTFKAWFNWSTGGSNAVSISASVIAAVPAVPVYSAVSSLSFTGAAGQVTSAPFIISNAGTGPLTFTISDTNNAVVNAYFGSNSAVYSWIDISKTGTTVPLSDPDPSPYITAADEGSSAMIPMKFAFPFYGGSYTQFCVSVNGALRLDTTGRVFAVGNLALTNSLLPAQMIAPYWGELVMEANSTIKYLSTADQLVITWENIRQYGMGGGSNQTFQAVLKPSGDITFQYKKLDGAISWPNTPIGLRDRDSTGWRVGKVTLKRPGDWIITTNLYGSVSTQYVSAVSNRAIQIRPTNIRTIGYTPESGTIAAGSNAVITITGDASSQSDGTNNISTNTTLKITHNASGSPASLVVTFTVTNSQEAVFVRAAASALADGNIDSDGDGIPDDLERIAGTDPQNADSVFTPQIERSSSGTYLSWPAPLDGVQRNYTLYFTTNLMSPWEYLYTVTNGVTYLDAVHSNVPAIYYKITIPVQ